MPKFLADGRDRFSIGTTAPAGFMTATPATVDEVDAFILASPRIVTSNFSFGFAASDTVDEKAIDQAGNAKGLGNSNFDAALTIWRYFNSSGVTEAVYDAVYQLLVAAADAGTPVYAVRRRTSKLGTAAYATGDEVTIAECLVDQPAEPGDISGYLKVAFQLLPQRWCRGTLAAGSGSAVPLISSISPSAAGDADVVAIQGARFTGTTGITFGGSAVGDFTIISDNLIAATMPTGDAGSAVCVVTNAAGASASTAYTRGD